MELQVRWTRIWYSFCNIYYINTNIRQLLPRKCSLMKHIKWGAIHKVRMGHKVEIRTLLTFTASIDSQELHSSDQSYSVTLDMKTIQPFISGLQNFQGRLVISISKIYILPSYLFLEIVQDKGVIFQLKEPECLLLMHMSGLNEEDWLKCHQLVLNNNKSPYFACPSHELVNWVNYRPTLKKFDFICDIVQCGMQPCDMISWYFHYVQCVYNL